MNGFCGIWRFDGAPISKDELTRCLFHSPQWEPDHQAILIRGNTGFVSTQRFISPEDFRGPMPYEDASSGCIVVADSFLSHREELARELNCPAQASDRDLILSAYLKWGKDCAKHLSGGFAFAIWDPREQKMFCAIDILSKGLFFYAHQPGKYFVFGNTLKPFRILCSHLTINDPLMLRFTLDAKSAEQTCYREISKIPGAHGLTVTRLGIQSQRYWELREQSRSLPYKTREEYYEAFRELFTSEVKNYSHSDYPVMAHISGGLDSSSVASLAAKLAAEKNKTLYGFTAIPKELEGPSYRSGWHFNEMPLVQTILRQYPNIEHFTFRTDPEADPFQEFSIFHPWMDLPLRNTNNLHWFFASLQQISDLGGRILLTGSNGNGSISWAGESIRSRLSALYHGSKIWIKPRKLFDGYFANHNPSLLQSDEAKRILRRRGIILNKKDWAMSRRHTQGSASLGHTISLWYGVKELDPTADRRMIEFCYNVPQWVYARGRETLERRLLIREALAGIVPEAVRRNPYRGEQAADWFLQYNTHALRWREKIENIHPRASSRLWQWYDKEAILGLFQKYSFIDQPTSENVRDVGMNLMRCLGLGFYLDYLERDAS